MPPGSLETDVLRGSLERHRVSLVERLDAGEDGTALGRANARFLNACFQMLVDGTRKSAGLPKGIALGAVGSFGRGAVAVRSDADVMLVVDSDVVGARDASAVAEALLYPLWDAGLPVGHQVLGMTDAVPLAQKDLATATALLDVRLLAGDASTIETLGARASQGLFGDDDLNAFIDRLETEAASRHKRFGGSVYLLEPDVKNGPGGLRDLDGARWAACARYHVAASSGDARLGIWGDLVQMGVLVAREAHEIADAEEFLWRLRNRLHVRGGRKADRLDFDNQEALAVAMRFGDDRARAAERLMQHYYMNARAATRAHQRLLERLRPTRRRGRPSIPIDIGQGIQLFDGSVTIQDSADVEAQPTLALRAFAAAAAQRAPLLPFARDVIARAADDPGWCERLREDAESAKVFTDLVCTVAEARPGHRSILSGLHDAGLLLAMVPEFLPVTGRVHHDVYHVYTVDVHSIAAVDRLRELARGELANEYPLASRLAAEIARPKPLFVATLLHDIGKGWPDATGSRKNHSEAGAELCRRILPRLGLSVDDAEEAEHLVRCHLLMYEVATRRDLDDRATIEEFCRKVRGREELRNLYLLTMADVSTTSPTAMTSWKARMMEELYFAAEGHLSGTSPRSGDDRATRVSEAVCEMWTGPRRQLDALLATLPERYLFAHRPESIVQHARAVCSRHGRAAHVTRIPSRRPEAAELCIVADDRPGLLAGIAAALAANRLEVLTAEVYSHPVNAEREALDLFWVRDGRGGTNGVEHVLPRLERDLEDVCSGRISPAELLRTRRGSSSPWSERPSPAVPTEILFDNRASVRHTILEVYAKDRPGLLYSVARVVHELGLSIAVSKINTEGMRVADVFYVCELDGSKIAPGVRQHEIQDALVRAVGR